MGGGRHGGFGRRHFFGGRTFVDWPWWWGSDVVVANDSCTWMPPAGPVPARVVSTLAALPWQNGSRAAFVAATGPNDVGGWWLETASPHAYYVCVVADSYVTGFGQALAERGMHARPGATREIAVPPYMPFRAMRAAMGTRGLGMDYNEHPTPGDYHVNGNGVVLRAKPEYTSQAIATLQNGENVYVLGDVQTDPAYVIFQDDTVGPNTPDQNNAGIDYVHVGTQTHGAGWIAMPYIEPGAGTKFGAPQPKPQPSPSPSPTPAMQPKGMSLLSKVLLGGAIVATVSTGAFLLGKAIQEARPRRLAHA